MERERRKIIHQDGTLQFLKPRPEGDWYSYGEYKSDKAVNDAVERGTHEFYISEEALNRLNNYRARKGLLELKSDEGRLVEVANICCSPGNNGKCGCNESCPGKSIDRKV